ncbi:MAG: hypothetical protein CMH57_07280 [Myxococcales bacterium]|nr:hypothetical protein [Myxococcales bacterium]
MPTIHVQGRYGFSRKNHPRARQLALGLPSLQLEAAHHTLTIAQTLEGEPDDLLETLFDIAELASWGSMWVTTPDGARRAMLADGWRCAEAPEHPEGAERRWGTARFYHDDGVGALAISPDGARVATVDTTRWSVNVCVWDAATGALLHRTAARDGDSFDHQTGMGLAWIADARFVSGGKDKALRFWDAVTGELTRRVAAPGLLNDLAVSADRQTIAATYSPGDFGRGAMGLLVVDAASGEVRHTISTHHAPLAVCFDPAGLAVVTFYGRPARRFDVASGDEVDAFGKDIRRVGALATGEIVALRRVKADRYDADLYDADLNRVGTLPEFASDASSGWAGSADGATIVSAHAQALKVWDVASRALSHTVPLPNAFHAEVMAFDPNDPARLWIGHGASLYHTGVTQGAWAREAPIVDVAVSGDGARWALLRDDRVEVFSSDGSSLPRVEVLAGEKLALSPSGDALALLQGAGVKVHDVTTGALHSEYELRDDLYSLAFLGDGEHLIQENYRGVALRALLKGQTRSLKGFVKLLPDPRSSYAIGVKGTHAELLTMSPRRRTLVKVEIEDEFYAGVINDQRAWVSVDETIRAIALRSGEVLWSRKGWSHALAVSLDGSVVAVALDTDILILDAERGEPRRTLRGHSGAVSRLEFLADGRLLSLGSDHSAVMWSPLAPAVAPPSRPGTLSPEAVARASQVTKKKKRKKRDLPTFKELERQEPKPWEPLPPAATGPAPLVATWRVAETDPTVLHEDARWRWVHDGEVLSCEDRTSGARASRPWSPYDIGDGVSVGVSGAEAFLTEDGGAVEVVDTDLKTRATLERPGPDQGIRTAWSSPTGGLLALFFEYTRWDSDSEDAALCVYDTHSGELLMRGVEVAYRTGGFVGERFLTILNEEEGCAFALIDPRSKEIERLGEAEWGDGALPMPGEETLALRRGAAVSLRSTDGLEEVGGFTLDGWDDERIQWDARSGQWVAEEGQRWDEAGRPLHDLVGSNVISAMGATRWAGLCGHTLIVRAWRSGEVVWRGLVKLDYDREGTRLALSPDERTLAIANKGRLRVLDIATGAWRETRKSLKIRAIAAAADGLWTVHQDGALKRWAWPVDQEGPEVTLEVGAKGARFMELDPAGEHALITGTQGVAHVVRLSNGEVLGEIAFEKKRKEVLALLGPDRAVLATRRGVRLVDASGETIRQVCEGHPSISALANGRLAYSAPRDGEIRVEDGETGARGAGLELESPFRADLLRSPDGAHLLTVQTTTEEHQLIATIWAAGEAS